MKTTTNKKFDTVKFFTSIKKDLAKRLEGMTIEEQRDFLKRVRDGEIKIT